MNNKILLNRLAKSMIKWFGFAFKIISNWIYRRQQLQFSPPIEELRMKYYGLLKRFLSIPTRFRGVDDGLSSNTLFQTIIHR